MRETLANYLYKLLHEIVAVDTTWILLAVLIVMSIMILDSLGSYARRIRKEAGLSQASSTVSVDGMRSLPVKDYVSDIQGLAGRPDAIVIENGYLIPIERKPTSNKIRDRYVAQLLVYMRLVEEFEGKKPPYGYLILGANCRRIKIENSLEKQAWLDSLIEQMRSILNGGEARATPHPRKCSKCEVSAACNFKALVAPPTRKVVHENKRAS